MALKDILFRRLEILIDTLKDKEIDIDWKSKPGLPPIGFDLGRPACAS
jgi:hypothetical protein